MICFFAHIGHPGFARQAMNPGRLFPRGCWVDKATNWTIGGHEKARITSGNPSVNSVLVKSRLALQHVDPGIKVSLETVSFYPRSLYKYDRVIGLCRHKSVPGYAGLSHRRDQLSSSLGTSHSVQSCRCRCRPHCTKGASAITDKRLGKFTQEVDDEVAEGGGQR